MLLWHLSTKRKMYNITSLILLLHFFVLSCGHKQNSHFHCVWLKAEITKRSGLLLLDHRDKQGHLPRQSCGGKSPVGQSRGPFSSLSQSSCFALAGSIQNGIVGSVLPCPCQQGIQAFLTRACTWPWFPFRVQIHPAPEHMWSGPLPSLQERHTLDHSSWVWLCVTVCVFMQLKFMTLFVPAGWQKALTLGSFSITDWNKKFSPYILQRRYFSLGKIFSLSVHIGLLFLQQRMIKMSNRKCHDDRIFALPP